MRQSPKPFHWVQGELPRLVPVREVSLQVSDTSSENGLGYSQTGNQRLPDFRGSTGSLAAMSISNAPSCTASTSKFLERMTRLSFHAADAAEMAPP
jgi:hypothetical protein